MVRRLTIPLALLLMLCSVGLSQDSERDEANAKAAEKQAALFKNLEATLSGAELTGKFTILGKDGPLREESYTIHSAKKMPQGDYWLLNTRIKYGGKDVTVPIPLEIKWAGETPVITLTELTIPGLGTFSSRVVIHNGKYAGTWTHGEVSGHLFGTLAKKTSDESAPAKKDAPTKDQKDDDK